MKRKRSNEGARVKVITDPRKLAWLKAEIAKRKALLVSRAALKTTVSQGE